MATMMMKTFVKPVLQVRHGKMTGNRPAHAVIDTALESDPTIDLAGAEYRLIMHCRGPEPPGEKTTQEQQGISARSRNH